MVRTTRLAITLAMVLLPVLAAPALAARPTPPPPPADLSFGGYQWAVKQSSGRVGPGPNYFSGSPSNVWVDAAGLHLTIQKGARNRWSATEVISRQSFGYGTYEWTVASRVDNLDRNVVLGLFTWNDAPAYAHREIDIEFARWSNASDPTNGQYVVQPYDAPGHLVRITQGPLASTTQRFTWRPGSVTFESLAGTTVVASWTYTGSDVPVPGGENARMNLWLFRGLAPSNGQPVEIVLSSFRHTPLP
jgi:hypothetical protein